MTALSAQDRLALVDSKETIPRIGFGVYKSDTRVCVNSVLLALQRGYRHIDTAQFYDNEKEVGEAVRQSGVPRSEVYVTTKIWSPERTVEAILEKARESVRKIGLGYVDLFLIHTPTSGPEGRKILWQALEKLKEEGGTKEIGVSNYGVKHLEELKGYAKHPIVVNQIELHPWLQQRSIVNYCKKNNIILEAYAPIVRGRRMGHPVTVELSQKHKVTEAQILIRWSLQKGFVPLPKSDREERIQQNFDVFGFELSEEDMKKLDDLDLGEGGEGAICPYNVHCP